jgi:hypothetical protein
MAPSFGRVAMGSVPLPAADAAFGIVFGLFVAAFAVLAVVTVRWAVRRDRTGRDAWRRGMAERHAAAGSPRVDAGGTVDVVDDTDVADADHEPPP